MGEKNKKTILTKGNKNFVQLMFQINVGLQYHTDVKKGNSVDETYIVVVSGEGNGKCQIKNY